MSRYLELLRRAAKACQPYEAHFELTRRCNHACTHCYQAIHPEEELSTEEWERVIEAVSALGVLGITFSGGEPLLREDLVHLARCVRKQGLAFRLSTNGILLDEHLSDELALLDPLQVDITVFSMDPGAHDAVTRREGSLRAALESIERLRRRGVRVVVNTPLLQGTWRGWREVAAYARSVGAGHAASPILIPADDGGRHPVALRLGPDDLRSYFAEIAADEEPAGEWCTPSDGQGQSHGAAQSHRAAQSGAHRPGRPRHQGARRLVREASEAWCKAGSATLTIGPSGNILPCVSLPVVLGNVRHHSLEEVWWHHPLLKSLRELRVGSTPICNTCGWSNVCGRCPGAAPLEHGTLMGPWEYACMKASARRDALGG